MSKLDGPAVLPANVELFCTACGSRDISRKVYSVWCEEEKKWVQDGYEEHTCGDCGTDDEIDEYTGAPFVPEDEEEGQED